MSFLERYRRHTEGYVIHAIDSDDHDEFSWSPCGTCGSKLGGARYGATLVKGPGDASSDQIKLRSCVDCAAFAANGQLPDEEPAPKRCKHCGDVLSLSWGAEHDFCRWESCEKAEREARHE